ncbi:hypothetical protein OUZ56_010155 [Daphnia magna]|uniref:Uncharacterized protein n=1 Tax=Daphnia magna TaxID=35525 RepID=A0ABR0AHY2_9CRUS|nr:hypothetical protein OUZ56_010155 [Daphnia magna]
MENSDFEKSDEGEYLQVKPTKSVFGNLKKRPLGIGDGLSKTTRKRRTLAFKKELCEKFKLEILLGIHFPTDVRKSWYFEGFGVRMKQFADETAIGKKIKTDLQLLSNSWFVDDKINLQEGVTAFSVITGPFVSAVGEEAVILAQQRGALDYKSLSKGKTVTDISTLQDELEWLHFEWLNVKDRVSALAGGCKWRTKLRRKQGTLYASAGKKISEINELITEIKKTDHKNCSKVSCRIFQSGEGCRANHFDEIVRSHVFLKAQEIRRLEDLRQVALSYAAFYRKDVVPEDVLKFLDDEEGDDETQDDYEMQEDGDEIQDDAEEG